MVNHGTASEAGAGHQDRPADPGDHLGTCATFPANRVIHDTELTLGKRAPTDTDTQSCPRCGAIR